MREDYYKKWGAYSHPLSLAEFEELNQNIFKEHLEEKENTSNRILTTKLYIQLILEKIKYFAYYIAFREDDFSKLNDALWQNGRTALPAMIMMWSNHSFRRHCHYSKELFTLIM